MGFQVSPGVDFKETDLTNVIPAVSTSIGGFAGHFNWGPSDEIVTVTDEKQLASIFGAPDASNAGSFLTAASFLKYASDLKVSRAVADDALNSVGGASGSVAGLLIRSKDAFEALSPSTITADRYVFARHPGAKGNSIKVVISYGEDSYTGDIAALFDSAAGTSVAAEAAGVENDEIHVVVFDEDGEFTGVKGTVLETYSGLSLASDAKSEDGATLFYQDVINFRSEYIYIASLAAIFQNADKALGHADVQDDGFAYIGDTSAAAQVTLNATVIVTTQNEVNGTPVGDPFDTTKTYSFSIVSQAATAALGNNTSVTFVKVPSTGATTASVISVDEANEIFTIVVNLETNGSNVSLATVAEIAAAIEAVVEDAAENPFILADHVSVVYDETNDEVGLAVYNPSSAISQVQLAGGGAITGATVSLSLINGTNGTTDHVDVINALQPFADASQVDINFLVAENYLQGNGGYVGSNQKLIDDELIEIAHGRRDILVSISAPLEVATASSASAKKALVLGKFNSIISSSYVVFDPTPVYVYNKYSDKYVWIPFGGHMAGLMAHTDSVAEPWFSPAGHNRGQILGVTKIAYNPSEADRNELYKARVNPVVSFPGQGTMLYGDKTGLSKPSAFDRINVRRLFITLQKAIATAAKYQLFEINDEFTQAAFRNMVEPYLRDVKGRRGVTDFFVVCDSTNNTGDVIDEYRFVGEIYVKPSRSINFVGLNFIATRTGVEFSEIVGITR